MNHIAKQLFACFGNCPRPLRRRLRGGSIAADCGARGSASWIAGAALASATIFMAPAEALAQPAPAMIHLICRPIGQAVDRSDPFAIDLHAAEGFLRFGFADGAAADGGEHIAFNKDSDLIQWTLPNGSSVNMFSLDRVSGKLRYTNGPSQTIWIYDCGVNQEQRKF
jgi:hypothetical protein